MDFPLGPLLDPHRCYEFLVQVLHPQGLRCPRSHALDEASVHKRDREPILDYRCKRCGRCFNVFTGTVLQHIKYDTVQIVALLRGMAQGVTTWQLAREMGVNRKWLLVWRHKLQASALERRCRTALTDMVAEADEMYQNAGEKRRSTPGSRRSAASACQQEARSRHVGHRPSARAGGRGT